MLHSKLKIALDLTREQERITNTSDGNWVVSSSRRFVVKWILAGQRAAVSRKADQTCPAKSFPILDRIVGTSHGARRCTSQVIRLRTSVSWLKCRVKDIKGLRLNLKEVKGLAFEPGLKPTGTGAVGGSWGPFEAVYAERLQGRERDTFSVTTPTPSAPRQFEEMDTRQREKEKNKEKEMAPAERTPKGTLNPGLGRFSNHALGLWPAGLFMIGSDISRDRTWTVVKEKHREDLDHGKMCGEWVIVDRCLRLSATTIKFVEDEASSRVVRVQQDDRRRRGRSERRSGSVRVTRNERGGDFASDVLHLRDRMRSTQLSICQSSWWRTVLAELRGPSPGKEAADASGPEVADGTNPTQVVLPTQMGLVDNVTGEPMVPIIPTEVQVDGVGNQQELGDEDGAESSHVGEWVGLNTGAETVVEPSMKDVLAAVHAMGTQVLALTRAFTPLVNSSVGQVTPAQTTARATQRTAGTAARVAQTATQVAQTSARTVEDRAMVDAEKRKRDSADGGKASSDRPECPSCGRHHGGEY
ncbi:hypothetical protein F2Q68_00034012 [Brassica cretica]|uniref:DUF4283 domain-containing protein n=1 Tax=Brassica cretica TaxID=69181 RepID=A0A8S9H513_BRACR|nr:hypothetical protein F2Q68_00034012 [Brassica cretica]